MQRADLARRAAEAPVQPSADQRARARTEPRHHEHHVVGVPRGPLPVFGDRRRVGVVLHLHRAAERAPQPFPERQPGPAGQRRAEAHRAVRFHDAGAADPDRPQGVPRHAGPAQQVRDRRPYPLQPLVGRGRLRDVLGAGADDPAVQPGQQYRDPVRADLDAQQVSRLGPEPEPARGAPLPSRALLGIGLDDESGPHEPLDDPFDGRPGEPGHPCEIGEGRRFGSAQCPEHHG